MLLNLKLKGLDNCILLKNYSQNYKKKISDKIFQIIKKIVLPLFVKNLIFNSQ